MDDTGLPYPLCLFSTVSRIRIWKLFWNIIQLIPQITLCILVIHNINATFPSAVRFQYHNCLRYPNESIFSF